MFAGSKTVSSERNDYIMKATGIVRRIDDLVIIGARSESLENTGVSLILSNFASTQSASCLTAASCNRTY